MRLWAFKKEELMKHFSQIQNVRYYIKLQPLMIIVVSVLLLRCPSGLWAKPVSSNQAEKAVRGWLKADAQPLGTAIGQRIMSVETFSDKNGQTTYYVVYLQPSGFVIVPGDDLVEPIICFAPMGRYDPSDDNPLGALVSRDVPGRIAAVRAFQAAAGITTRKEDANNDDTALQKTTAKAQGKWSDLQAYADSVGTLGLSSVSDVRVAPLTQSTWGQTTVGNYIGGISCYNYYTEPYTTPDGDPDNYPCGCVATSMAQLMRYHEHPSSGPSGMYIWGNMPLQPDFSITLTERQAIGHLCHDAAESVDTEYGPGGSLAYIWKARDALPNIFGYSNAIDGWNYNNNIGAGLNGMVNPNLDSGYPALLGIHYSFTGGGHAVVADGYGYNFSTLYHHINMGWSGTYDAWYNLPNIDSPSPGPYNIVDECIYNIFVSGWGEIISGRVTNETSGEAISGVNVTAERAGGGTYNATTNSNGIYALVKVPSSSTYTVSVAKSGCTFTPPSQIVYTGTSIHDESTSGNRWGINFEGEECSLDAPVLHAEPNITPGVRNTISWDAIPDATWYYAECANDADFANAVIGSGWISDTNCTFTGLDLKHKYWYRVKAAPRIESWSQTSKAEFQTDTLTNTRATNDGDVVLTGGPVPPVVDTVGGTGTNAPTSDGYFNGFFVTKNTVLTQIEIYLGISTSTSIEFVIYEGGALFNDPYNRIHSSTLAGSGTGTKFYSSGPISVSLQAGKYYMFGNTASDTVTQSYNSSGSSPSFASHAGWGTCSGFPSPAILSDIYIAAYTFYHRYTTDDSTDYASSGSAVSSVIELPASGDWGWDVVDFNATMPENTELTIDVLNGSDDSVILADVNSGTDINRLTATELKLRANLSTDDPANTPALHDWSISYAGPCQSNWSNVESSLQCDTLCDFDNNNEINFADFSILAGQWKQAPGIPSADIAPEVPDGRVDIWDLAVFVEKWLLDITCTVQN
jgi:hypothetical protein